MFLFSCPFLSDASGKNAHVEGQPDPRLSQFIVRGIQLIYNWQFDEAETLFRQMALQHPADPAGYFYLAMVTWSRMASGFWGPRTVNEYLARVDQTIRVARSRIKEGNPDAYDFVYLGGALGFKGRFELMRNEWLASFFLAREAIEALKACLEIDPKNKDVLLGLGIFDYYTARLSGVLKFLSYLLVHRGDENEGLRKLWGAAQEAKYSSTEAKSVLLHIYLFLEKDYQKALGLANDLVGRFPLNPRNYLLRGVCYMMLGMDSDFFSELDALYQRSRQASSLLEAAIWGKRALYLETAYDLYHEQYLECRKKLKVILDQADPKNDPAMIAWPLLKIGTSFDLEGKRGKALRIYQDIRNMKNASGAQFLAQKFLDKPPKKTDPFLFY
jgi:tetratricopeptide (TPR) repeat protein